MPWSTESWVRVVEGDIVAVVVVVAVVVGVVLKVDVGVDVGELVLLVVPFEVLVVVAVVVPVEVLVEVTVVVGVVISQLANVPSRKDCMAEFSRLAVFSQLEPSTRKPPSLHAIVLL